MFGIKLEIGKEFSLSECHPLPTYEESLREQEMEQEMLEMGLDTDR